MSHGSIPSEFRVEVTVRKLDGVAVAPELLLINAPPRITYDVQCIDAGIVFTGIGMIPKDRIVSPAGAQVDIQAASFRAVGWVRMMPTGPELRIQEGIVFSDCG